MIKDHDRFNKISGGLQSVVVSIAVLVGGGWTLYSFISLDIVAKAKADLEKTRAELSDVLQKQAVLETTIASVQGPRSANGDYHLAVTVTLQNKGARNTEIQWTKATPLTVKRLIGADGQSADRQLIFVKPVSLSTNPPVKYLILAGGTLRLPFLVRVPGSGLYYLEFQTEVSTLDIKPGGANKTANHDDGLLVWSDAAMVLVGDKSR
jgi:hypothetical protein